MKKARTATALLLSLVILTAASGCGAETYIDLNGYRPDQTVYQGYWQNLYLQILDEHSYKIHSYQNRPIETDGEYGRMLSCFPVGLQDLNGDGVPELVFMEANGERGDLWIYSGNADTCQCVLYVPGITRLDYDEMQGFEIHLLNGNLLSIRHYRYKEEYLLQFYVNKTGPYDLFDWLNHKPDGSREGEDRFFRNGQEISSDAYYNTASAWFENGGTVISDYLAKNEMSYGFDYTYETAVAVLVGNAGATQAPQPQYRNREIYGLTIDKLATRKGPGTQYDGGGTYNIKNQYVKVLAKAWDSRNGIWWIKCEIPYKKEIRVLWTGYKRFDHSSFNLDDLPEEVW
ncbi:MAG: hypothetical protein IKG23_12995 [Clostridia bacterium]|nr:hypothetical protein [Clostridia bacterium]